MKWCKFYHAKNIKRSPLDSESQGGRHHVLLPSHFHEFALEVTLDDQIGEVVQSVFLAQGQTEQYYCIWSNGGKLSSFLELYIYREKWGLCMFMDNKPIVISIVNMKFPSLGSKQCGFLLGMELSCCKFSNYKAIVYIGWLLKICLFTKLTFFPILHLKGGLL